MHYFTLKYFWDSSTGPTNPQFFRRWVVWECRAWSVKVLHIWIRNKNNPVYCQLMWVIYKYAHILSENKIWEGGEGRINFFGPLTRLWMLVISDTWNNLYPSARVRNWNSSVDTVIHMHPTSLIWSLVSVPHCFSL